jgi:SET domain-containing protein
MYRPLPECLTIQTSSIHGLGLFASKPISAHTNLGITHHKYNSSDKEYIRTPLGGFINHSDTPNCIKMGDGSTLLTLKTLRPIHQGEELTVTYTLYTA